MTASEVRSLEGEELLDLCRHVALEINRLQSLQVTISNQIWLASEGCSSQDTLTKRLGCRDSVELIQRLTGESARAVSARVKLARQTAVRSSLLGEELPPTQEHVADALESGCLNVDAANHISRLIAKNTQAAKADDLDVAERCLVQAATGLDFGTGDAPGMALHVDDVRQLCAKWDEALNPDGAAPDDAERLRKRFLNLGPTKDGLAQISGLLTAEVAAAFGVVVDSLNNPRAMVGDRASRFESDAGSDTKDSGDSAAEFGVGISSPGSMPTSSDVSSTESDPVFVVGTAPFEDVVVDDPTDDRTAGQKRHDALATALDVALASRDLPVLQGANATIVVELKEENLSGCGPTWLVDHQGVPTPLPVSTVYKMSCGANIQAVVRDSLGRISGLGSPARVFTANQRRAIALRDGGCVIPGCTVPAAWCEVHHVMPHALGGLTHTDNGVLLCRFHHSTIDTSGWSITMCQGIPLVRPPTWMGSLYRGDPRLGWVNQVLADQTRRIRAKLERRRSRGRPLGCEPDKRGISGEREINRGCGAANLLETEPTPPLETTLWTGSESWLEGHLQLNSDFDMGRFSQIKNTSQDGPVVLAA